MDSQPFTRITPLSEPDGTWGLVPLRGGFAVPRRFVAEGEHVTLHVEVDPADKAPNVRAIEVRAPAGEVLTGESLRLPLHRLARRAMLGASRAYEPVEPGGPPVFRLTGTPPERVQRLYEQEAQGARQPRRGAPVTDEQLRQVADLYRAAVERGDPPTRTIEDTMHVARSTASRWVARARERGLLGPATHGRAGEAKHDLEGK
jgi:hypothetical protein